MSNAYLMMLFSLIIFTALGAYFTQVLANSGMKKHPCFCPGTSAKRGQSSQKLGRHDEEATQAENFEQVSAQKHQNQMSQKTLLELKDLCKLYGKDFKAVDHLSVDMY